MTEHEIQDLIKRELSKYGIVLRLNVGRFKTSDDRYISSGLPPGVSDLEFIGDNIVAFIEVKKPGGRATPEQLNFIDKVRKKGCRAGIAHSVEEAFEIAGVREVQRQ